MADAAVWQASQTPRQAQKLRHQSASHRGRGTYPAYAPTRRHPAAKDAKAVTVTFAVAVHLRLAIVSDPS